MFAKVSLHAMIEDIVAPLRGSGVGVAISVAPFDDGNPKNTNEPVFPRNPAITYGLSNLIENAIDFAQRKVTIEARWSRAEVLISIRDDGPGFAQEIIDRLGDPFVTTRPGYESAGPDETTADQHEGMGLGFFIAKTLLERSGAQVSLANLPQPDHGAIVQITWPRSRIDAGKPPRISS
jgi:two-component system sensor histidine kinase RegB